MAQFVWKKIAENLDFVENSNFIRENTETAVRGCPSITLPENTHGRALL